MLSLLDIQRELEKVKSELKATRNALDMAARRLSIIEGMQSTNDVTKDTGSDVGVAGDEVYKCLDIPVFWGEDDDGDIQFGPIKLHWDGEQWTAALTGTGIIQTKEGDHNKPALHVTEIPDTDETLVRQGPTPTGTQILAYLANLILVEPCPSNYYACLNALARWYHPTADEYGVFTMYFDGSGNVYPVAVWL